MFISLYALAAILIFLLVDGQTFPKLPLNINVNAYVSFCSNVAKGTMLVAVNESISQLKWLWFRKLRTLQDIQLFDNSESASNGCCEIDV